MVKNKDKKPGTELKADGKRFYPLHSTNGSVLGCNIAFEFITKFINVLLKHITSQRDALRKNPQTYGGPHGDLHQMDDGSGDLQ